MLYSKVQHIECRCATMHGSIRRLSDPPLWLNEATYRREVQPRLKGIALSALAWALGISIPYATDIHKRSARSASEVLAGTRESC
jgi:hypothetical protein